jgi:hypothetical protein
MYLVEICHLMMMKQKMNQQLYHQKLDFLVMFVVLVFLFVMSIDDEDQLLMRDY